MSRNDYGGGSIYKTKDGRYRGALSAGWTERGTRKRITVSGKSEAIVKRKLRDLKRAQERGEIVVGRTTIKQWADTYLQMRVHDLRPKAYRAAESPIRKWVIPTIGGRRLDQLTPGDIRAVDDAQRNATPPVQPHATRRVLTTMLNWAIREGHTVPPRVLKVPIPKAAKSDRQGMSVEEGIRLLEAASRLDHGTRWLVTILYGVRLGEALGLTWDAVDFDAGEIRVEWQLQPLPYNIPRDRKSGFRIPDGFECRHLVDSFHLVRPKSGAGLRVAPMLPAVRDGLMSWRGVARCENYLEIEDRLCDGLLHFKPGDLEAPCAKCRGRCGSMVADFIASNQHGLVWPDRNGRPRNDKHDREEWWRLQAEAGIAHPSGRPYHVHECRNFAATMLLEAGVDEHVITSLLGHSSIVTSRRYMTVRREPLMDAMRKVGERLALGEGS